MDQHFHFPLGGIDLARAFARQMPRQIKPSTQSTSTPQGQPIVSGIDVQGTKDPQYWGRTTPLGINVRGFEPEENRKRGGSRPGLSRFIPAPLVAGWLVQNLNYTVRTPGMQTNSSGRVVTLVAVNQGNVYWALAGDTVWTSPTNATSPLAVPPLIFTGVVRSAVLNQLMYFADGTNWVYFNPTANTVNTWTASAGTLPVDSNGNTPRLIVNWRERICLSGLLLDPQTIFMSAQGDATNFDYSPNSITPIQAVALAASSPAGQVGDIITCMIPYTNDLMVVGGDHTIYIISGDPMQGGQVDLVSNTIGMAFGTPWCMDPYGNIYFVSNKTGIYTLMPGQQPQRISQQIEQLLFNVDTGLNTITLLWDDRFQGLHVFLTPTSQAAAATHLFYEQRTGAWWQDRFANNNHNPLCCVTFDGNTAGDRVPLIGSWDGYVRAIDPAATMDDGWPINSQVILGPILTQDMDDMMLYELQAVLGTMSTAVSYNIYVGQTAEGALASAPVDSGVFQPGRDVTQHVRRSGHAIYVGISASTPWAMEEIRMRIEGLGAARRRSKY
jgi:hypothetical protein